MREVTDADLPKLRDLERAAGGSFRDVGMDAVADDEPPPLDVLAAAARAGRILVLADDLGTPVAYVLTGAVDGAVHVEQLSVDPAYARRGLGRILLEAVAERAGAAGASALTLTTFVDVPWNAPYYRKLGFVAMEDGELTAGLRRIREDERARGLERWPRVAMRRTLGTVERA